MAEIIKAGDSGSLGDIDTTQGEIRAQFDQIVDAVRQLGGNVDVGQDPLSAPYVLYVDSNTGSDTFVTGDYKSTPNTSYEDKMRRISMQRLECGYSIARPFKTVSRAIIEAGIITSRDYLNIDPAPCGDLVSIVLAAGVHEVWNDPGNAVGDVKAWSDGYEPDAAELQKFNPQTVGGLILPRGCSLISMDLRKTIVRPNYVPAPATDSVAARRCIFRTTSGGYYYGMTFMDKVGFDQSHHLLSVFEYSSKAQLDDFYSKIRAAFSSVAGIDDSYATTRTTEYQIVGDFPATNPPASSDTVAGSSPYIYNCSIRSVYGICGLYADGSKNGGLSSTVIAQYTGVSLQKDMRAFQTYSSGTWSTLGSGDFTTYRDTAPDNVRMRPEWRNFHIKATNGAVIQEVSVFAIGQGIHHEVESGAEITITNSNSNFGGASSLSKGYNTEALPPDKNWRITKIRVATDMSDEANNIRQIALGKIEDGVANNATTITLEQPLTDSPDLPGVPDILATGGYTLRSGSYVWIENPSGLDYYAPLAANAWNPATPDQIVVTTAFVNEEGDAPAGTNQLPSIENKRIYIRRLLDVRSVEERQYTIFCSSASNNARTPIRDYVLQTDVSNASIDTLIPNNQLLTAARSAKRPAETGYVRTAQVELRRNNAQNPWTASSFYRTGDVVQRANKHWIAVTDHTSGTAFDETLWDQNYVHMEDTYYPEDFYKNAQPLIVFDDDADAKESSTTLGWFTSGKNWDDSTLLQEQYRTATDYKGMHSFLVSIGFSAADSHTILLPKPIEDRDRDPSSSLDSIGAPSGAANAWANWAIDFRRPSGLRLFAHAWEYTGWSNYTKALPKYQGELSDANKFTYYFTNQNGGRVYPSGFNEEGFAVSSRGLENVETGQILTPEQISSSDQEIIEPPTFNTPATIDNQGLVKIASQQQIKQALDKIAVDDDNKGFAYVVRVNDLGSISDQVLSKAGLLPDSQSILYVDNGVGRTSAGAIATTVPSSVKTQYNINSAIHGATPVEEVAFRSLGQALEFINGRSPVSRSDLRIKLIGATDKDQGSVKHSSERPLIIEGTTEDRTDSVAYIGGTLSTEIGAGKLSLYDCTIASSGTIGNPTALSSATYTIYLRSELVLNNCKLTINTTEHRAMSVSYDGSNCSPSQVATRVEFNRDYPTVVEFDTSANGTYNKGGYVDFAFGDFTVIASRGKNYDQNELIFRQSQTDPAAVNHIGSFLGDFTFYVGGYQPVSENPASFDNYGNYDLKVTMDYTGTAATNAGFRLYKAARLIDAQTQQESSIGRSTVEFVVNAGGLTTYQGFKLNEEATFTTIVDKYRKDPATPLSEMMRAAYATAGVTNTDALTVGMYNTYNEEFISVGGGTIAPLAVD